MHTGLRTFQCPYCPLTFKWSSHYQYHLRQHTGECPYPCDSCPKAFKNSSSLRRHKNVHLGLKPYVCTVCNKAFTQSTNLRQHMRVHTGERPYVCNKCGRSFTHSSNLALHRASHLEDKRKAGPGVGGEHAGELGALPEGVKAVVVGGGTATTELSAVGVGVGVGMGIQDMVGFVGQDSGLGVGVGEVFLTHHTSTGVDCAGQTMLTLTPTTVASASGSEQHVHVTATDMGTSVLLYSCGSCNHTFTSQGDLEEHQALHLAALGHGTTAAAASGLGGVDGAVAGAGAHEAAGVSLVGAGPLLADFEEVVETTTVAESGQGAAELLGLTGGAEGGVGGQADGQAQFELLQGFTEVSQLSSDASVPTDVTGGGTKCTYCGKSFKTSGGLTRHIAQVGCIMQGHKEQFSVWCCLTIEPISVKSSA